MIIYLVIAAITLVYIFFKQKYSYWRTIGVPYIEPKIPLGNLQGRRRCHTSFFLQKFYNEMKGKGPIGGIYFFIKPIALVLDLDLAKHILVKDFHNFRDRGLYHNEKDDPLSAQLLSVDGDKWKFLRHKLTPTFTSGKIKMMFSTVCQIGEEFVQVLNEMIKLDNVVEIKDLLARFTTDIIGTCAFGIECNSLNDPNAEFRKYGKRVFEPISGLAIIKQNLILTFQNIGRFFRATTTRPEVRKFFLRIVRETVEYREKNNIERNDFMNLLLQLKNSESNGLTLNEIAAQAYVFFLAGFETSSTAMTYALYELALHQNIQDKARKEINDVIEKHDGKFTYETLSEMTYLMQVLNESLRKYPPAGLLIRRASQDYNVPNTQITLKKGTSLWIPVYSIHHDPELYPNPEVFDPERFTPEAIKSRHTCAFLAFGEGPRNCIGLRFGIMQATVGLVTLLKNFRVEVSDKTPIPLVFNISGVILSPKDGLYLKINKL